ncbi:MAG: hypothetical protein Ct9H300mP3_03320 [Gammaproteobacteria bacterium]|nr:MAG: hypothetical protein Ct9H300mP3_03320 [Gammaproteobacteria bacterium]
MDAGIPESFNVLTKEIRSLGIDLDLSQKEEVGEQNERFNQCVKGPKGHGLNTIIKAGLAFPQQIRSWAYGEVKKTRNYKLQNFQT